MIDIENFETVLETIINSEEFAKLQDMYNKADHVFLFGHGGNMAIAEHAAVDASRLTDKNVKAPGGGTLVTSIQSDFSFDEWILNWLRMSTRGLDKSKCLAIGLSCSLNSKSANAIVTGLNWADDHGMKSSMVSAQYNPCGNSKIVKVVQNVKNYHTSELLSLALTYQLIHGAGFKCPSIIK